MVVKRGLEGGSFFFDFFCEEKILVKSKGV